jgi:hypothetical protein
MLSPRPPLRIGIEAVRAPAGAAVLDDFAGLLLAFAFAFVEVPVFDDFVVFDDFAAAVDFFRVDFFEDVDFDDLVECFSVIACFAGFVASGLAFATSGFAASGFAASGGIGSAAFAGGPATSRGDKIGCANAAVVVASTPATSGITSLGHLMKRTISGVRLPRWIWRSARR